MHVTSAVQDHAAILLVSQIEFRSNKVSLTFYNSTNSTDGIFVHFLNFDTVLVQLNKLCSRYLDSQNIFHQQEMLYIPCTKHWESEVQHLLRFPSP